jgi:4-amino-4-deoxy-L-arabinose transferase-like glycosyltransferase
MEVLTARRLTAAAGAIAAVYVALAAGLAVTKRPWCDEAWYASPGVNLATRGHMGTSVLDPAGTTWKGVRLDGIDRHTYWAMPLHFLAQAGWYKLFGTGLFPLRALSVLWGAVALAAWYMTLRALLGNPAVALGAAGLLACDFFFLDRAADGRMDMMSAALAAWALAAYLNLRTRRLGYAVAASHALAAAAFFTHPNGGIMAFLGLAFFTVYFDRRAVRLHHVALAAAPYLAGAAGWGLYVLEDPAAFRAQFFSAAANRWDGLRDPWGALLFEIRHRYLMQFGFGSWSRGLAHVYVGIPLAYAAALAGGFAVKELRRDRGFRALLLFTVLYFGYMALLEGFKTYLYLVHILPLFTAVLAVGVAWCRRRRLVPLPVLALAVAGFVGLQLARTGRAIAADGYRTHYLPAVSFLKAHAAPSDVVMGSAELAFELGYRESLVDDIRLGHRSGKRADWIVVDEARYADNLQQMARTEPEAHRHAMGLLEREFQPVYRQGSYTIYARRADTAQAN